MKTIKKKLLKDIAYEKIKEKIQKREVAHMSENELVKELSMSRTPIREALHRLQHEGFVKIISNQGIVVKEISVDRLHDLIDMRMAIETFSLYQAKKNISQQDFLEIEKIIDLQKQSCINNDIHGFKRSDAEFHYYLLSITGNYYFLKMFSEAHELQFIARSRVISQQGMEKLIKEHEEIVASLKDNQLDFAVNILKDHLNSGKRDVLF